MATVRFVKDATEDDFVLFCNDVRKIPSWHSLFADGCEISGLLIQPETCGQAGRDDVIEHTKSMVYHNLHIRRSYIHLFLCHGLWQPDNRIVNYRKIWKDSFFDSIAIPPNHRSVEICHRSVDGVRYASALQVDEFAFPDAARILIESHFDGFFISGLDLFCNNEMLYRLFEVAFQDECMFATNVDWGRVIHWAASSHNIIIKQSDAVGQMRYALDIYGNMIDFTPVPPENLVRGER